MGYGQVDAVEVVDQDAKAKQPGDAPTASWNGLRWRGQRVGRGHVVWGSGCSTKGRLRMPMLHDAGVMVRAQVSEEIAA